ncbi:MAG: hypothetical protein AUI01_03970 [Ktedonobacter sp. 13_2_20CM_2_56_8]|nr:MAG: hypothetical protein AUI01_03970 [Ktedonobacter sp. 13_2_20CM_2_56_8]
MAREHSLSTSSGTITIAQAQPSDIDIVISILEEAGQWLLERGIYQWLPGSFSRDRIASSLEHSKYGKQPFMKKRAGENR